MIKENPEITFIDEEENPEITFIDEEEKIDNANKSDAFKSIQKHISRNACFITSFFVPVGIMILLYILKNIYPFGDEMYLRSDCYHQYAPFLQEMYNKIHNGGSLLYSWNIGTGCDFMSLFAYYLASPLNWILLIIPGGHITEMVSFFVVLKTGFCGLTMAIYLSRHFNTKKISMTAPAIFYALSAYMAAYSWNIMWLDCLYLLPLVVLGIELLVNDETPFLYIISLGICVFSNYYIAIMICIYSLIYFFVLVLSTDVFYEGFISVIKKGLKFAVSSLIAGGLGMIMVLPAYFGLLSTASSDIKLPESIINYFSVLDMVSRSLMAVDASIFDPHNPNLYASVGVFLLLPLYFINKKIDSREKIAKGFLLGFFLLSFNTNVLNLVWHGFHYPNSLPARESFIYIFLVLTMCYEAMLNLKHVSKESVFKTMAGAIALILIIEKIYVEAETYEYYIIYLSIAFILIYTFLIRAYKKNLNNHGFIVYVLCVACIAESTINMNITGLGTTSRSAYLNDNANITAIVEHVKEQDSDLFYRIEKDIHRTKNDAAWNNYKGVSVFSSASSSALTALYKSLGFETSFNAYSFYGYTPLTSAILDVKYILSTKELESNESYDLASSIKDELYIYKNKYVLPLAFMVDKSFAGNFDNESNNPFYTQNSFVNAATDTLEIFHPLDFTSTGNNATINMFEDGDAYFYIDNRQLEKISVNITDAEGDVVLSKSFQLDKKPRICHLGLLENGYTVELSTEETNITHLNLYAYSLNHEELKSAFNELNSNGINITSFKDTDIKGEITASEDGLMFTSIPYDKGWTVYVDGKKVKTTPIKDAFLGFYLDSGSHTIEFKYFPPGLKKGMCLSTISLILLVAWMVYTKIKRKKEMEDPDLSDDFEFIEE